MRVIDAPSPNFEMRKKGLRVDMLVLHYTGMKSAEAALARLRDPNAKVSAHYMIDEDGALYRLVGEHMRAWHAGLACWRGIRDVNGRSIGIELVNPGHEWGYRPFPESQMRTLTALCRAVTSRHPIAARNVVGHSDVAPARKTDPGELFDWAGLAEQGVGLWTPAPDAPGPDGDRVRLLAAIGYDVTDPFSALEAFRRRFLPQALGAPEDEPATLGRLRAVATLYAAADGP